MKNLTLEKLKNQMKIRLKKKMTVKRMILEK
jgi:hypothetical protein